MSNDGKGALVKKAVDVIVENPALIEKVPVAIGETYRAVQTPGKMVTDLLGKTVEAGANFLALKTQEETKREAIRAASKKEQEQIAADRAKFIEVTKVVEESVRTAQKFEDDITREKICLKNIEVIGQLIAKM